MMEKDDKLKSRKMGVAAFRSAVIHTLSKTKRAVLLTKAKGLNKWSSSVQKYLLCCFLP